MSTEPKDQSGPKPIETKYKGYRFRSRLEARWAVVFDELRMKWRYEPEGFQLSCGNYLPDFYIEDWNLWVEVKPSCKDGMPHKAIFFAQEKSALLLLFGTPGEHFAALLCQAPYGASEFRTVAIPVEITFKCGRGPVLMGERRDVDTYFFAKGTPGSVIDCLEFPEFVSAADAFAAGRSARFEFGESGAK